MKRPVQITVAAALVVLAAAAGQARAETPNLLIGVDRFQGPFLSHDQGDIALSDVFLTFESGTATNRFSIRVAGVRVEKTGQVTFAADAPVILGAGGPGKPGDQDTDAGSTETGVGDILFRSETFMMRSGQGNQPALSFILDYKLSVAAEEKGLGTGQNDWGGGLSYTQPLGKVFQILGDATFQFMGSPQNVDFKDRLRIMLGFAIVTNKTRWRITGESVAPALDEVPIYDAQGVATGGMEHVDDWRVLKGEFVYVTNVGGSTRFAVLTGLNDSSPKLGFSLSFASRPQ
jgi:hypothetical protein